MPDCQQQNSSPVPVTVQQCQYLHISVSHHVVDANANCIGVHLIGSYTAT